VQSRLFRNSLDSTIESTNLWARKFYRDRGVDFQSLAPIDAFYPISNNGIENKKKEVYHRMICNTLQLDSNISNYDATVTPNCKYCNTSASEKYSHWLNDCPTLKPIILSISDFNVSISMDRNIISPRISNIDVDDEKKMAFFTLHLLLVNFLVQNKKTHSALLLKKFWEHIETECKLINLVNNSVHILQNFSREKILYYDVNDLKQTYIITSITIWFAANFLKRLSRELVTVHRIAKNYQIILKSINRNG
jgi:hypothetical protein